MRSKTDTARVLTLLSLFSLGFLVRATFPIATQVRTGTHPRFIRIQNDSLTKQHSSLPGRMHSYFKF